MALITCPDCGMKVSSHSTTCPNCGAPLNQPAPPITGSSTPSPQPRRTPQPVPQPQAQPQPQPQAQAQAQPQPRTQPQTQHIHAGIAPNAFYNDLNEEYYSVDFNWFHSFTSDPVLLLWAQRISLLRWIFAPWHIGEDDEEVNVNHIIANDIFFILNRFWKLLVYPNVWAFFKGLPFFIVIIILFFLCITVEKDFFVLLAILGLFFAIYMAWITLIGFTKSIKRYGIPLIHAFRHMCSVFVVSIKNPVER